ncbi:MAG TPA: methyltransferase [Terriglobia bacterium]|nr:methyltransferase [Terriglobia bacterium]
MSERLPALRTPLLWLRGIIFSVLAPGIVAGVVPQRLRNGANPAAGWWRAGWILFAAAILVYLQCLLNFLLAGGTPAIFFTRPIRFLLGAEPGKVVKSGLYRYSRNPMYLSVLGAIAAQAVIYRSLRIAIYAALAAIFFHFVVVFFEEPHLARVRGADYQEYRERVPRWIGRPGP